MPKAGKGTARNEPSQELGSSAGKETEEVDALAQVVIVVGDHLAFLLFGALGRESHGLEVTLATAPVLGAEVTAGFVFDVPVRFDADRIEVTLESFGAGRMVAMPLIEVRV